MKKVKILIIIVSIITLILICAIVVLNRDLNNNEIKNNNIINNKNLINNNQNNISNTNSNNTIQNNITNNQEISELRDVEDRNDFYTVKSCVEKYISYIVNKDNKAVYNLLDEAYIKQKNINESNILNTVEKIEEGQVFTAKQMKVAITGKKEIFTVYGTRREDKTNSRGNEIEFNVTVILNTTTKTFSVIPEILNVKSSSSLVGNNKENEYNKYTKAEIDNQTMANIYFVSYKSEMLYNLQNAYNLLDEEYSEKRFKNFTNYQLYVESNIEKIKRANLIKYSVETFNNYNIYTCIDQYNNYYIFKETAIMQYTVMLDDYTIDSDNFIKNYHTLNLKEKVELNIQKFIKMLNNKDYNNAYNVLSDGFKNNYFATLQEFENYVNNNFYNYNDVVFINFTSEGEIGIYEVTIRGVVNNRDAMMTKTIIMQLGSGTDFKMSFDV